MLDRTKNGRMGGGEEGEYRMQALHKLEARGGEELSMRARTL